MTTKSVDLGIKQNWGHLPACHMGEGMEPRRPLRAAKEGTEISLRQRARRSAHSMNSSSHGHSFYSCFPFQPAAESEGLLQP